MTPHRDVALSSRDALELAKAASAFPDLAGLEAAVRQRSDVHRSLRDKLEGFVAEATKAWNAYDHVIVRGVPLSDTGANALLLAATLFANLKTYRGGQIVKHFQMSPWTTALSHTLAAGHFHTDINTAPVPPSATLIQCIRPDPDAPRHGQLRVVRLCDLLWRIRASRQTRVEEFLTEDTVTMVNDTSRDAWSGRITDGTTIRFHPETLRAGERRCGSNPSDLEDCLRMIHESAEKVSEPINLDPGDVLVVSNRRTLHQRGACTVRFRSSRRDFDSRAVAVLHAMDEPE